MPLFLYLSVFAITSKMTLNRSAESCLPYFVSNLKINHFFFTIKFDVGYVLVFFFF